MSDVNHRALAALQQFVDLDQAKTKKARVDPL
jgi:hypothetical protein